VKKDLEEYEKELETLWELHQTACGEQEKGSEMNYKNGKMDVMIDFIKKIIKLEIHYLGINIISHIGFSCFIAGLKMRKREQNKPDDGKKAEKCVK
jgi:hypothetical protein